MRKLVWFAVGFSVACVLGAYFMIPFMVYLAVGTFAMSVALRIILKQQKLALLISVILLGLSIGFGWFYGYDQIYLKNAKSLDGKTQFSEIQASDYSYNGRNGSCFDGGITINNKLYRVRVYLHSFDTVHQGDIIKGNFSFQYTVSSDDTENPNPGKGIFLVAYQDDGAVSLCNGSLKILHYPAIWRKTLLQKIDLCFDKDVSGFCKALMLGDRSDMDYAISSDFQSAGISHIIAVSGLHVSILFGLVYFVSGKRRVLTALLGIPTVVLFMALVGFSPSVVRAGIMQILIMLALLFDREYDKQTALAFSVLCMLAVNPMIITSISFQMSVCCMIGIFLFAERIFERVDSAPRIKNLPRRIRSWICGSISITLSATVFTAPLSALYFGAVSLIGFVSNLLLLWLVTSVFYGIMLVCGLSFLSLSFAKFIAMLVSWIIKLILLASRLLASLPLAAVYTQSIYYVIWFAFCYALFALFLYSKKKSLKVYAGAAVLMLCVAVTLSWLEPMLDDCRVTVLDVGQGQCVLLESDNKTFLVDCGGSYDKETADVASQTLRAQGIFHLDGIILTHYDKDHVGGAPYLMSRVPTDSIYLPLSQDTSGIGQKLAPMAKECAYMVSEDMILEYGDTKITIFAPISYASGNESSMCVLLQTKKCDILITGDRDILSEEILLQRNPLPQLDVLVVGHHGAQSSTGEALLQATNPKYAIISVGKDNAYGHPSNKVLKRLEDFGCTILRTDYHGTIRFRG